MPTLSIYNPATDALIAEVPADDAASVARKAVSARAAQGAWAALPMAERLSVVKRFREAVVTETDALALTLTSEVGKPITQSKNELRGLLPRLDFFLEEAEASIRDEVVYDKGAIREVIEHVPLGVVGNISAWNYPYFVGCNVLIPALLTGNAVLYKPSEFATLTGQHILRLLHASGVPSDVVQGIVGSGDVGALLLEERLDGLFFTGSHATGQHIAQTLAPKLVKVQLELGGKDPTFVRADADPKAAAEGLADGAMYNAGQSCCSVERIYVHESLHDAFVEHFLEAVAPFKIGDPTDASVYIGAIARRAQLGVLEAQVADAVKKGATLRAGGKRRPGPGNWFEPTVLTGVDHTMDVMREESFGPIIGIQSVSSDDDAIRLMNDTRYGLTAGVYSKDEAAARALLSRVNAGSVYWNCCDRVSPRLPWSGHGDSGIGLTLSRYGIQTFTRPKAWHLRRA